MKRRQSNLSSGLQRPIRYCLALRHTAALSTESDITGHSDIKLIDAEKKKRLDERRWRTDRVRDDRLRSGGLNPVRDCSPDASGDLAGIRQCTCMVFMTTALCPITGKPQLPFVGRFCEGRLKAPLPISEKRTTPDRGVGLDSRTDRLKDNRSAQLPVISRQKVDFASAGEMRPCAPSLH